MSSQYNNGSHYEDHQLAAELRHAAAHAHRMPMMLRSTRENRIT